MPLPKLSGPTTEVILPSTGAVLRVRPYTVADEETLLIAMESGKESEMFNAVKQIVQGCVVSGVYDVERSPLFDLEYLLLKIRAAAVSESVELVFSGLEGAECAGCRKEKKVKIDLTKVEITRHPEHTNRLQLTDSVWVVMRYPAASMLRNSDVPTQESKLASVILDLAAQCIAQVVDGDKVFEADALPPSEVKEFLSAMTAPQFAKIRQFFDTMPSLTHTVPLKCEVCGKEDSFTFEGIRSFFE